MRKEFYTIQELGAYVLSHNLRVEKRDVNIAYLHNNTTKEYTEAVVCNFED